MRYCLSPAALIFMGLTLACGGGGTSSSTTPTGNLTLRLGSDSFPGYSQAVVSLEKVEASTDGASWTFLGNVKATLDLMALQNGHSALILPATTVPAATYSQFRITWATVNYSAPVVGQPPAPANYVIPTNGFGQNLSMPVTTVVNGLFTVPSSGSATALIMLTGQQLVQSRAGGVYAFQATGAAYDQATTARITGLLSSGTTSLPFTEVLVETVDGSGLATIKRRSYTDTSGTYVMEGLPTGSLYFVVAQPASSIHAWSAVASSPVNVSAATTYTADLAFGTPQTPGSMTITITPASLSTQGTWGELRQTLTTGTSGSQVLIVRSQPVATGLTQDQVGFAGLAPGTYGVTAQRSTALATPVMKTGTQVLVSAAGTATTTLTIP